MRTGEEYDNRCIELRSPIFEDFFPVDLQLTSHRLVAKVRIDEHSPCAVFFWNWENENLYSVGVSCFIPLPKTRWSHRSVEGGKS